MMDILYPLVLDHCCPVNSELLKQTLAETKIVHCRDMGQFAIYHGFYQCAPIVIVANHDKRPEAESAVWYDVALPGSAK